MALHTDCWVDGLYFQFVHNWKKGCDEAHLITVDVSKVSSSVEIPSEVNGVVVAVIQSYSFTKCTNVTEVWYPDSVKYIGERTFCNCGILETFASYKTGNPAENLIVAEKAFYGCKSLRHFKATVPVLVGAMAFEDCVVLHDFAANILLLNSRAFCGCMNLRQLSLAHNVKWKKGSFSGAKNLKNLVFLGDIHPDVSETYLSSLTTKTLHCTSAFSHTDLIYKGAKIFMT